jgi:hypothetical protein
LNIQEAFPVFFGIEHHVTNSSIDDVVSVKQEDIYVKRDLADFACNITDLMLDAYIEMIKDDAKNILKLTKNFLKEAKSITPARTVLCSIGEHHADDESKNVLAACISEFGLPAVNLILLAVNSHTPDYFFAPFCELVAECKIESKDRYKYILSRFSKLQYVDFFGQELLPDEQDAADFIVEQCKKLIYYRVIGFGHGDSIRDPFQVLPNKVEIKEIKKIVHNYYMSVNLACSHVDKMQFINCMSQVNAFEPVYSKYAISKVTNVDGLRINENTYKASQDSRSCRYFFEQLAFVDQSVVSDQFDVNFSYKMGNILRALEENEKMHDILTNKEPDVDTEKQLLSVQNSKILLTDILRRFIYFYQDAILLKCKKNDISVQLPLRDFIDQEEFVRSPLFVLFTAFSLARRGVSAEEESEYRAQLIQEQLLSLSHPMQTGFMSKDEILISIGEKIPWKGERVSCDERPTQEELSEMKQEIAKINEKRTKDDSENPNAFHIGQSEDLYLQAAWQALLTARHLNVIRKSKNSYQKGNYYSRQKKQDTERNKSAEGRYFTTKLIDFGSLN